jgi:cellulose synthase/poly-beta-1,6-N-acetylglucosamine synthase-like glycosyltransferase
LNVIIQILWLLVLIHIALTWGLAIYHGWIARRYQEQQSHNHFVEYPPVSIIVPAWNEQGTLQRCVLALQNVDYPLWEAILVAGGDDGTYAAALQATAADSRFRVLARGSEPKNAALERGVQAARYDVLVLLDADNIVEPGWLKILVEPIARGAAASVGDSAPNRITWVTLEEQMWHIHTYQVLRLSWIQGDRSIAIRKDVLQRVGGLPVHTYAREDWDLGVRLEQAGYRVVFAEGARLVTDRPATLRESWVHQLRWRRTHLSGLWEHRRTLLKQPFRAFFQLYGYILSLALSIGAIIFLLLWIVQPGWHTCLLQAFLLVTVWLCARRAALAGELAAYTGEWLWLARLWMPLATLGLELLASLVALLSLGRQTPFYKGPRYVQP